MKIINLFQGDDSLKKEFYCWVDHDFFMADHNYRIGSFIDIKTAPNEKYLMFIIDPDFSGFISPFHRGVLNNYGVEYNLELGRINFFQNYPSRLASIFLLESEEEAFKYRDRHLMHVGKRILRKGITSGPYEYSRHDSSWVDFLRLDGWKEPETINNVNRTYWAGGTVEENGLTHFGKPWSQAPIFEILYSGRIDFIKS